MITTKYPQSDFVVESEKAKIPGLAETTNFHPNYSNHPEPPQKTKSLISRFFSNMSRFGMRYEDDVIKNMRAIPADNSLISKQVMFANQDLFGSSNWKVKSNADKNFFEKDLNEKRDVLRKLAVQPELEDILDTLADESIVYDSDQVYFAEPFIEPLELAAFKKKVQDGIITNMNLHFRRFYKLLNWKNRAWDDFKKWLVEGILAWEIVWDSLEQPTKIIGVVPLDPATLTRSLENNKYYWIQFKGSTGKERRLLDSQVIYIAYQEANCIDRQSYLERLIRPYNIYRIVEQAQLIWTITNASFKMKFTVPVKGMNRANGEQTLVTTMQRYKEDIKFEGETGELKINGQSNLPFNKEYWFPDGDYGTPEIETLGGDGPDLNNNDQLTYFKNQLYKVSKIPPSRFDTENTETFFGTDVTSVARTEINFSRFVNRLRGKFAMIMIKLLQLQLACDFPELQDNRQVLEGIQLQFKSYNLFEEMLDMELMEKRTQFIQGMKDSMIDMDMEGNEVKFFSSKFLVQKYLRLSPQDLEDNERLKQEEADSYNLAGKIDSESDHDDDLI